MQTNLTLCSVAFRVKLILVIHLQRSGCTGIITWCCVPSFVAPVALEIYVSDVKLIMYLFFSP